MDLACGEVVVVVVVVAAAVTVALRYLYRRVGFNVVEPPMWHKPKAWDDMASLPNNVI